MPSSTSFDTLMFLEMPTSLSVNSFVDVVVNAGLVMGFIPNLINTLWPTFWPELSLERESSYRQIVPHYYGQISLIETPDFNDKIGFVRNPSLIEISNAHSRIGLVCFFLTPKEQIQEKLLNKDNLRKRTIRSKNIATRYSLKKSIKFNRFSNARRINKKNGKFHKNY